MADEAAAAPAGAEGATTPPEPPAERTFTQAELDRIVQDRVARVKREVPEDYEELKQAASKWSEFEESQKTELEKAQAAAKQAEKEAAKALKTANERLIQAEILAEATAQKAIKPEHMHRLIERDSVTVGDDGQVTGIQEAVKAFLEANPEYVGSRRPAAGSVDQGARGTTPNQLSRDDLKSMTPEAINKAREEGRLDTILGRK